MMIGINGRGGSTRTKDGAVRATVRNVEESDQVKPAASKVVKSTERRRGKSPGSKTSRTRLVYFYAVVNIFFHFCYVSPFIIFN